MEELCKQFKKLESTQYQFVFFDTPIKVYSGKNKFMLMLEHIRQQVWKQIILPWKAWQRGCDIVYCNDYFAPYFHFGYKTVQVFHDALFYEHPEFSNPIWLQLFKKIAVPAARRSAFIITPTLFARERVHHFTKIPLEKIIAIHQGPKTLQFANTAMPSWLPTQKGIPYLLHVGVLEKRKNLPNLIHAFKKLKEAGFPHQLVLIGKGNGKINSDDSQEILTTIDQLGLQQDIIMPGYLPDELLSVVYQNASLYVFPSINEGFGIPILEAFQFSIPVIVANNTCLPEVGAEAVISFDPFDPEDIYQKMSLVLNDASLQETMKQKGLERLKHFSWNKTAISLLSVFEKAIQK